MSKETSSSEQADLFGPLPPSDRHLANLPRNDFGNGQRLLQRYGHDLISVADKNWYVWDGTRFNHANGNARAAILCHKTAQAINDEARALENDCPDTSDKNYSVAFGSYYSHLEAHRRFARSSGNSGRIAGMLKEARPYLQRPASDMDADPMLFNTGSGTLNLSALEEGVRPHNRDDLITRIAGVAFDPDANAPMWQQFLDEILPNKDVQTFLQRWFGYCLSGLNDEQRMVVALGSGANGKSVLMSVVTLIFGDYAIPLAIESLLYNDRKRGGDPTPDLMMLPGARLVVASEPEIGARLSESMVKISTGGEKMTARPLYANPISFDPTFKLMFSCNTLPVIRGQDNGIWRRMLVAPFTETVPPNRRDTKLAQRLYKAEAAGILNWMLDGWRRYGKSGLLVPTAVQEATDEYRTDSDPIGQFVADCVVQKPGRTINASTLYCCYEAWCQSSPVAPLTQHMFGRFMKDRGFCRKKRGLYFYTDIALTPTGEKLLAN